MNTGFSGFSRRVALKINQNKWKKCLNNKMTTVNPSKMLYLCGLTHGLPCSLERESLPRDSRHTLSLHPGRPSHVPSLMWEKTFLSYFLKSCSCSWSNWKQKAHSYMIFTPSSTAGLLLCHFNTVSFTFPGRAIYTSQNVGIEFLLVPGGSLVCPMFPPTYFFFLRSAIS